MKAKQFINYCLNEYDDLSQEKDNIIKTISGLDAADEKQAAILDRIWKVLNTESYNTNIVNSFVAPTKDEYMNDAALQKHRTNVAEIISRVDSDYNAMNGFLKKLETGGVININELAKPINSFNAIFGGDAVAIKAFDALKGYGVQAKAKGPGEYALAMLSNKIRLAEGAGDTEIEGIGDVEVKSAASDSAKGGRLGDGGPQQEQQMGILLKYEDRLPNMIAGIKAKAGGTIGIGPFVNALNAEAPLSNPDSKALRLEIGKALWEPQFRNYGTAMANKLASTENRNEIEFEYVRQNFEWYKARDNFDAYLVISFLRQKRAMGRTGQDIISMREANQIESFGISVVPSKSRPGEVFAQISLSGAGV